VYKNVFKQYLQYYANIVTLQICLACFPPLSFRSLNGGKFRTGLAVNLRSQRCVWRGRGGKKTQTPHHWPKLAVGEGHLSACIQAFNLNRTASVLLGIIKIRKEIPIKASNPVSDLKLISDDFVCLQVLHWPFIVASTVELIMYRFPSTCRSAKRTNADCHIHYWIMLLRRFEPTMWVLKPSFLSFL